MSDSKGYPIPNTYEYRLREHAVCVAIHEFEKNHGKLPTHVFVNPGDALVPCGVFDPICKVLGVTVLSDINVQRGKPHAARLVAGSFEDATKRLGTMKGDSLSDWLSGSAYRGAELRADANVPMGNYAYVLEVSGLQHEVNGLVEKVSDANKAMAEGACGYCFNRGLNACQCEDKPARYSAHTDAKKVGEVAGISLVADPSMPKGEWRMENAQWGHMRQAQIDGFQRAQWVSQIAQLTKERDEARDLAERWETKANAFADTFDKHMESCATQQKKREVDVASARVVHVNGTPAWVEYDGRDNLICDGHVHPELKGLFIVRGHAEIKTVEMLARSIFDVELRDEAARIAEGDFVKGPVVNGVAQMLLREDPHAHTQRVLDIFWSKTKLPYRADCIERARAYVEAMKVAK